MRPVTFRPLSEWPGARTSPEDRRSAPFSASYSSTLELLDVELKHLEAVDVVLEVDVAESMIRADGYLKERARIDDPGVILSFDSRHGPLRYAADRYSSGRWRSSGTVPGWQANLRAIALGLEALRKVDRYGITASGEQYRGFRALGEGQPMEARPAGVVFADVEDAARYLLGAAALSTGSENVAELLESPDVLKLVFRAACRATHPDAGGRADVFLKVKQACDRIEGARK